MKLIIAVIAAISLLEGAVHAAPLEECDVPQSFLESDTDLTRVTKEDQDRHRLDISVIGTGSSALSGPDGVRFAYPARLEDAELEGPAGVFALVHDFSQPGGQMVKVRRLRLSRRRRRLRGRGTPLRPRRA